MPCIPFRTADGVGTGFICTRGRSRSKPCATCGGRGELQCDYPLSMKRTGATCDRWICRSCATHVGPDKDLCPAHARANAPRTNAVHVATAPFSYTGQYRLDITRKSATSWAKSFAPSWTILRPALAARAEGREEEGWAAYVPAYLAEMRRSYVERRDAWNYLLDHERVVLVCYCENAEHCHRTILARDILPKLGATYEGELS